jgi:hypothetical protein
MQHAFNELPWRDLPAAFGPSRLVRYREQVGCPTPLHANPHSCSLAANSVPARRCDRLREFDFGPHWANRAEESPMSKDRQNGAYKKPRTALQIMRVILTV